MSLSPRTLALLDAILYTVLTLGLAVGWHLQVFAPRYAALGFPGPGEADIALGFLAIATQAVVLGVLFQLVAGRVALGRTIVLFCATAFAFLWSSHVIGDAAKCRFQPKLDFIAIETFYLVLQFAIYGGALALVHRNLDSRCKALAELRQRQLGGRQDALFSLDLWR